MCYLAMGMSQPYYSYPMRMPQPSHEPSRPFRVRVMSRAKDRAKPIARVTVRFMIIISGRVRIRIRTKV